MFRDRLQSLTKYKRLLTMGIALVALIITFVPLQDQSFLKAQIPAPIDEHNYGPPPSPPPAPPASPKQIGSTPPSASTTGTITIRKVLMGTTHLLPNATFKITPNPFTLSGSLLVHDNDGTLDSDLTNGIIR